MDPELDTIEVKADVWKAFRNLRYDGEELMQLDPICPYRVTDPDTAEYLWREFRRAWSGSRGYSSDQIAENGYPEGSPAASWPLKPEE